MNKQRLLLLVPSVLILAFSTAGCHGMQLKDHENRIDKLEARVAVLESQVQALTKK
jgi:hypothetical protein